MVAADANTLLQAPWVPAILVCSFNPNLDCVRTSAPWSCIVLGTLLSGLRCYVNKLWYPVGYNAVAGIFQLYYASLYIWFWLTRNPDVEILFPQHYRFICLYLIMLARSCGSSLITDYLGTPPLWVWLSESVGSQWPVGKIFKDVLTTSHRWD